MKFAAPQVHILGVDLNSLQDHLLRVLSRRAQAVANLRDALSVGQNALAIVAESDPLPLVLLQFMSRKSRPILSIGIRGCRFHELRSE
jgi:hypothetical protein